MKSIFLVITALLVLCGTSYSRSSLSDPNRLRFYDTSSSYRCSRRIISLRESQQSVLDKCGEPDREAYIRDEGFDVWIYGDNMYVYYLLFIDGQLERILSTRCWNDNPDCEAYNSRWDRCRNSERNNGYRYPVDTPPNMKRNGVRTKDAPGWLSKLKCRFWSQTKAWHFKELLRFQRKLKITGNDSRYGNILI